MAEGNEKQLEKYAAPLSPYIADLNATSVPDETQFLLSNELKIIISLFLSQHKAFNETIQLTRSNITGVAEKINKVLELSEGLSDVSKNLLSIISDEQEKLDKRLANKDFVNGIYEIVQSAKNNDAHTWNHIYQIIIERYGIRPDSK